MHGRQEMINNGLTLRLEPEDKGVYCKPCTPHIVPMHGVYNCYISFPEGYKRNMAHNFLSIALFPGHFLHDFILHSCEIKSGSTMAWERGYFLSMYQVFFVYSALHCRTAVQLCYVQLCINTVGIMSSYCKHLHM